MRVCSIWKRDCSRKRMARVARDVGEEGAAEDGDAVEAEAEAETEAAEAVVEASEAAGAGS